MNTPIGPGRLVLVIGPSGAGKDTIIDGARAALQGNPHFVFARRVVTRPASASEDHGSLSSEAFDNAIIDGAFALHWHAHDHKYGIPRGIDDDIRAGRTVICNVSRTIITETCARYASISVVSVTAPAAVLAQRLADRGRERGTQTQSRLKRNEQFVDLKTDLVIENVGPSEQSVLRFIEFLRAPDRQDKNRSRSM